MKRYLLPFLMSVMVFLMAGCGKSEKNDVPKTEKKGKHKIAVMPKLVGIPYFNQTGEGAEKAGKDLNVEVIYTGPTTGDAVEQVKMIEDLINRGVDAICVAPNDPAALTPALRKARDKGIIVIDWDTPADKKVVDASVYQVDDKELGELLVDDLVKYMGTDKAEYAILTGVLAAANLNIWINYALDYAKVKYPDLKLVASKIPTNEKQQEAYSKTLNLIKTYPNLKGIIAVSTPAPLGAAQAVREKGLQDKITVVGTAVEADSKEYLQDGSLKAGILWDPVKLGYLTVEVAKVLLDGKKLTNDMTLEKFGKIRVKDDGKTVIMGPPLQYIKN